MVHLVEMLSQLKWVLKDNSKKVISSVIEYHTLKFLFEMLSSPLDWLFSLMRLMQQPSIQFMARLVLFGKAPLGKRILFSFPLFFQQKLASDHACRHMVFSDALFIFLKD